MKALITATVQSHICQFHKPLVEVLHEKGYEVHIAARNNLAKKNGLKLDFVDKVYDIPFNRSPKSLDNIKAYKQLKDLIDNNNYDLIVCNTPVGGVLTRLAAKKVRRNETRVIYIAHGFHFYKGSPKKNWLIFYPIEKYMSQYCDTLITINEEDYRLAKDKFKNTNVEHIHGVGVDENRYHPVDDETKHELRKRLNLSNDDFMILCTGELLPNKNQQMAIRAVKEVIKTKPNTKLLLAGNGPEEQNLRSLIKDFGLEDSIKLLGYRKDLETIVPCVDVVISCSHREGLGLNVIEAMLCEKPVVVSKNRGHNELVKDGYNGYIFDDIKEFVNGILNTKEDMGIKGFYIANNYTFSSVKKEWKHILNYE